MAGSRAPELHPESPYEIVERIGAGAMGDVWLGREKSSGRRVVIKVMHGHLGQVLEDRLRLEAQALAKLRHPNIVEIYGWGGTLDRRPFLVLEHLVGKPLDELLRTRRWLPAREAIALVRQLAAALVAVHAVGMVHRDIKPSNAFVCEPGTTLKLLDFGIIKLVEAVTGVVPLQVATKEGSVVGTPRYMSPEQIRGKRDVDGRADVYATGLVLYQLVTGVHPFDAIAAGQLQKMMTAHLEEVPPPPSAVAPEPLPAGLDAIVMRAIAKARDDRFTSTELLGELGLLAAMLPPEGELGEDKTAPLPDVTAPLPDVGRTAAPPRLAPSRAVAAQTAEPTARRVIGEVARDEGDAVDPPPQPTRLGGGFWAATALGFALMIGAYLLGWIG